VGKIYSGQREDAFRRREGKRKLTMFFKQNLSLDSQNEKKPSFEGKGRKSNIRDKRREPPPLSRKKEKGESADLLLCEGEKKRT